MYTSFNWILHHINTNPLQHSCGLFRIILSTQNNQSWIIKL